MRQLSFIVLYVSCKDFVRGEVLYQDSFCLLKDEGANKIVKLITKDGALFVHTDVHAVKLYNGHLCVYTFDSFINHSCEPNSTAIDEPTAACDNSCNDEPNKVSRGAGEEETNTDVFTTIATRAISCGEEITTDYDTFIYRYKGIPRCQCGSERCRGFSFGFQSITPESAQLALLPHVHPAVRAAWLRDNMPRIRYWPCQLPSGLGFRPRYSFAAGIAGGGGNNVDLIATKFCKAGDLLYACSQVSVDPSLTDIVIFAVENPWVQRDHATNTFEPLAGMDIPIMKLDTCSIGKIKSSQKLKAQSAIVYFSMLDALESCFCHSTAAGQLQVGGEDGGGAAAVVSNTNDCNCAHRLQLLNQREDETDINTVCSDGKILVELDRVYHRHNAEKSFMKKVSHYYRSVLVATADVHVGEVLHIAPQSTDVQVDNNK